MNLVAPTPPKAEPLEGCGFGPDAGLPELRPGLRHPAKGRTELGRGGVQPLRPKREGGR